MVILSRSRRRTHLAAFTTIELIVVIILIGVMAAVVLPFFSRAEEYAVRSTRDELISAARYAQQLAMADPTLNIRLQINNSSFAITKTIAGSTTFLAQPDGSGDYPRAVHDSVTLSPAATLTYSNLGSTTALTVTINGHGPTQICIESTGFAHAC